MRNAGSGWVAGFIAAASLSALMIGTPAGAGGAEPTDPQLGEKSPGEWVSTIDPAPVSSARAARPTRDVVHKLWIIDGDTFVGRVAGTKRKLIIRNAGIQAMEDRECGKREAKKRLGQLLGKKIVIVSQTNSARPNGLGIWRVQRNAFTPSGRDIQSAMLKTGLVLPYGIGRETMKQEVYAELAQRAALAGRGLFSGTFCRPGPVQEAPLQMMINYDASGRDWANLSGKFVRIRNLGAVPVPIGRWRLRGAAHDSFYFPADAVIPAGGEVVVRLGWGSDTPSTFYWEGDRIRFFVPGQSRYQGGGGYLFDRDGDIRAWSMYPCRVECTHPAVGNLRAAVARGESESKSPRPAPSPSTTDSSSANPGGSTPVPSSSSSNAQPTGGPGGPDPANAPLTESPGPSANESADASQGPSFSATPSAPATSGPEPSATPSTSATPGDGDRSRERVWFTNTSSQVLDLSYTVAKVRDQVYEFPLGTLVEPRERLVVFSGSGEPTRLRHFLGVAEPFLFTDVTGGTAKLRTHSSIRLACVAWGEQTCANTGRS